MKCYSDLDELSTEDDARFSHFIPNYLAPLLTGSGTVCSVGCGTGLDVQMLCERGFDAYGFDPGMRTGLFERRPTYLRDRLKLGRAESKPFGDRRFDAVYALEVIEHVGCLDFHWSLEPDASTQRQLFIDSCLAMVAPGGFLFLSTSNRLCPIDPGHGHHYTSLGAFLAKRFHLGLSIPWHSRNFLWSIGDICEAVARAPTGTEFRVESLGFSTYPKAVGSGGAKGRLIGWALGVLSSPWTRGGPLAPILCAKITRAPQRPPPSLDLVAS